MYLMLQFQRSNGTVHVYEVQMVACSEWIIGQVNLTVVLSKWNASQRLHQSTGVSPTLSVSTSLSFTGRAPRRS